MSFSVEALSRVNLKPYLPRICGLPQGGDATGLAPWPWAVAAGTVVGQACA